MGYTILYRVDADRRAEFLHKEDEDILKIKVCLDLSWNDVLSDLNEAKSLKRMFMHAKKLETLIADTERALAFKDLEQSGVSFEMKDEKEGISYYVRTLPVSSESSYPPRS